MKTIRIRTVVGLALTASSALLTVGAPVHASSSQVERYVAGTADSGVLSPAGGTVAGPVGVSYSIQVCPSLAASALVNVPGVGGNCFNSVPGGASSVTITIADDSGLPQDVMIGTSSGTTASQDPTTAGCGTATIALGQSTTVWAWLSQTPGSSACKPPGVPTSGTITATFN